MYSTQLMVASFLLWAELQGKAHSGKITGSRSTELGSVNGLLIAKAGLN